MKMSFLAEMMFDPEDNNDKDLFDQYSLLSLLLVGSQYNEESLKSIKKGKRYKITIEETDESSQTLAEVCEKSS